MPVEAYMHRCLELAQKGLGHTAPNPMVGAVIVCNEQIIGEGYHAMYANAHAEVNAIESVTDKSLLKKASIYVSLEPCAHYGKTPPCAELIIKSEIPEVVIACRDPFSKVQGEGIRMLRKAGIKVTESILENEAILLNRRFFCFHQKKRPYIILKWAESIDGFVAGKDGQPVQISNKRSKMLSHKWRAEEQAILVGYRTALNDNPKLTCRYWYGKNPLRVVLDTNLQLNKALHIFDDSTPTLILTQKQKFANMNGQTEIVSCKAELSLIEQSLDLLYSRDIQSVIIEGGTKTLQAYIDAGLWDEARVFTGNCYIHEGISAPKIKKLSSSHRQMIADDCLTIFHKS